MFTLARSPQPKNTDAARPSYRQPVFFPLVVLCTIVFGHASHAASVSDYLLRNFQVGGDFELTNQLGRPTGLKDFEGQVVLLSFGFTNCPDVCPTTMAEMAHVLRSLGSRAKSVRVVFVSVDPERDTPERLQSYLAYFDESIVGLTGSVENVAKVAELYNTQFEKQRPNDAGEYSVDHTSFVYVLDPSGRPRYVLPYDAGPAMMLDAVRALLDG